MGNSAGGLWGLIFGNGGSGGDPNTLFFADGINGEADGLFAALTPAPVTEPASLGLLGAALAFVAALRRSALYGVTLRSVRGGFFADSTAAATLKLFYRRFRPASLLEKVILDVHDKVLGDHRPRCCPHLGRGRKRGTAASAASTQHDLLCHELGLGKGGDLGGLEGADRQCQDFGTGGRCGRQDLAGVDPSTQAVNGATAVNARDRIGSGPWQNFKGEIVAKSVADLHSPDNKLSMQTSLTERGTMVAGRGYTPNYHDALTGSQPDGRAFPPNEDRDAQQLDEQQQRFGDSRPHRPQGVARRRRIKILEFLTSFART